MRTQAFSFHKTVPDFTKLPGFCRLTDFKMVVVFGAVEMLSFSKQKK